MTIKEIMYFDAPDRKNSDVMAKYAVKRIQELGIQHAVVVWSTGYTFRKFFKAVQDAGLMLNIVAATNPSPHSISRGVMPVFIRSTDDAATRRRKEAQLARGIKEISTTISDAQREKLEKQGVKVCYLNDDLMLGEPLALRGENVTRRDRLVPFGVGRHIRPLDIDTGADLSLFTTISQGFRVCVGCTVIAVKSGCIPEGATVLAIGGESTALVLRAGSKPKTTIVKEIVGFERGSSHFERDPEHPEGD